ASPGSHPRMKNKRKPPFKRARDPLEHLIAQAACNALGVALPALDTPLFEAPHGAAGAPALADAIARACDVHLSPAEVAAAGTVREIAYRVRGHGRDAFAQRWRSAGPHAGGVPVFYVHGDP